jgi:hypothetical protein
LNKQSLEGGERDALGDKIGLENSQLILPYIISTYKVQIHYKHFRGLHALSWHFIITLNSLVEVGRIFEHFFEISSQNSLKMSPFSESIMQKTENCTFSTTKFGGVWYETSIYISQGPIDKATFLKSRHQTCYPEV